MKRAATETSDEIKNSAECTAFRAITVSSPARMAAIANIQKKTDSQPERIIADFQLPIADLKSFLTWLATSWFVPAPLRQRSATAFMVLGEQPRFYSKHQSEIGNWQSEIPSF